MINGKVTQWRVPTVAEAKLFASALELQVPGEVAVAVIDQEILPECLLDVAEQWARNPMVRANRFDLRAWMGQTDEARQVQALSRSYNGMAWYLVQTNLVDANGTVLQKALKFMEVLERRLAGTKQAPLDEATKFWAQLQAGKVPHGGGRTTTVGIADLRQ
jgi:hypothetical protein